MRRRAPTRGGSTERSLASRQTERTFSNVRRSERCRGRVGSAQSRRLIPRNRACAKRGAQALDSVSGDADKRHNVVAVRDDNRQVATVVPAEGVILECVRDAVHLISPDGLSRPAFSKFDSAQMKTGWGRRHRRRLALVNGADVLASATQYDLAAVLDQRPLRVCGIGEICTQPSHRTSGCARELVDRLLDQAARDGAAMALLFSDMRHEHQPAGFDVIS
jgi:GNAT superfamily N-acetyltransferase